MFSVWEYNACTIYTFVSCELTYKRLSSPWWAVMWKPFFILIIGGLLSLIVRTDLFSWWTERTDIDPALIVYQPASQQSRGAELIINGWNEEYRNAVDKKNNCDAYKIKIQHLPFLWIIFLLCVLFRPYSVTYNVRVFTRHGLWSGEKDRRESRSNSPSIASLTRE